MRRLAIGALAVALLVAAVPAGATRRPKLCGRLVARGVGYGISVERGPVRCRTAKRIMRAYLRAPRSRCAGSHCLIRIHRWDCIAGDWQDPFAAVCTKAQREVWAYNADV